MSRTSRWALFKLPINSLDTPVILTRPFHIVSGVQHGLRVLAMMDWRCPHHRVDRTP
jgi:hypothetical protein